MQESCNNTIDRTVIALMERDFIIMNKNISKKIRELMTSKKISITDMYKSTGLNRNTIYGIVSGSSSNPTAHNLQLIAAALDVSLDSLIMNKDNFTFEVLSQKQMQAFSDATVKTIKIIIERETMSYHLESLLEIIKKVYQYSIQTDPPIIEERFINWLISNLKN